MRLAVDGTSLCYSLTGIGQYTRSLLDALAVERPSWEFVVLSPYRPLFRVERPNVHHDLRLSRARSHRVMGWRAWWFDAVLPRVVGSLGVDVFWAASGLAPFSMSRISVALTVHDFVAQRYPDTMAFFPRVYRKWNQERWVRRAKWVLPISWATANELRTIFGVEPHAVVYPGVDEIFSKYRSAGSAWPGAGEAGYLVFIGTLEPRKNLAALAECVEALVREGAWPAGLEILAIGAKGWRDSSLLRKVERLESRGVFRRLGYLPRAELPELLAGARALLMPSLYEGFGMPVAEALAIGCPIVCTDLAPFREIIGCGSAWFHGADVTSMLGTYRRFLTAPPTPRSGAVVSKFTWPNSAKVFASAVERKE